MLWRRIRPGQPAWAAGLAGLADESSPADDGHHHPPGLPHGTHGSAGRGQEEEEEPGGLQTEAH